MTERSTKSMSRLTYLRCPTTGKRSYPTRQAAERMLGKAQTDRLRRGDARGSRRGIKLESRVYPCDGGCGGWHLTEMSRREYNTRAGVVA